jgi:hypothetical protein
MYSISASSVHGAEMEYVKREGHLDPGDLK